MKVYKVARPITYTPITIILETEEEANLMYNLLNTNLRNLKGALLKLGQNIDNSVSVVRARDMFNRFACVYPKED